MRSRRPTGAERRALDAAFVLTPLASAAALLLTRDCPSICAANLAGVVVSYAWAFADAARGGGGNDDRDGDGGAGAPAWLKFAYRALDFGSGRERGARG
jgi:hypothetical protein